MHIGGSENSVSAKKIRVIFFFYRNEIRSKAERSRYSRFPSDLSKEDKNINCNKLYIREKEADLNDNLPSLKVPLKYALLIISFIRKYNLHSELGKLRINLQDSKVRGNRNMPIASTCGIVPILCN